MKRAISARVFHERLLLNAAVRCVAEVRDFQKHLLLIKTVKDARSLFGDRTPMPLAALEGLQH
jgi:hypothetical protein